VVSRSGGATKEAARIWEGIKRRVSVFFKRRGKTREFWKPRKGKMELRNV